MPWPNRSRRSGNEPLHVPLIQLQSISKRFGGVTALDRVSFDIRRGEVHALVGENGAGKSTLMKLLAGVHEPDHGEIRLDGESVRLSNPRMARRRGISTVFQELNLFPHRSITANVFANREIARSLGWLDGRSMRTATLRVLRELDLALSPETNVGQLRMGEKQLVEIARALAQQSYILILDEPTSSLNEAESQRLFGILRRLRQRGVTIVYVSHRLEEVFAIADRITVLRDGRYQGTSATAQVTVPEIVTRIIGRPAAASLPARRPGPTPDPVVLQVRELCQGPRLGPVSFTARSGEIVGFAGLEGSGVSELFQALFGLKPVTSGEVMVGPARQRRSPPQARIQHGWALVPASRREQGLMMPWSMARNATLLILDKLRGWLGVIDQRGVRRTTNETIARLGIHGARPSTVVAHLSGGNQQKVLLAKWLAVKPAILMLDDPTRGVDVGAKREIYTLCQQLVDDGVIILMTSSEVEEVMGLADRIIVLARGKFVQEFQRGQTSKGRLVHAMAAGQPA